MSFKIKILILFIRLRWDKWRYKNKLDKLRKKHWQKMQPTLRASPFYKNLANIGSDLSDYPIVNKALFMANFDAINTQNIALKDALEIAKNAEESRDFSPMIGEITIGLSSGTSGNTGVFLASEDERALWVATVLDRVIGFSFKKRTVAFFLRANSNLYGSAKSKLLAFHFFDLLDDVSSHIERLNALQPNILVAQPSLLLVLADAIKSGQLHFQPEKIISVAEVLYPEDEAYLKEVFSQQIHQVYQCTEGFLAATCTHGTLHFNEDFLVIEKKYIDEEKVRFHLIVTDLKRSTQPVIRYELNDIIHEKKKCPCGSKMLGIAQIEGRSDDVLCFENKDGKTVKIFPDFFRRAIILSNANIRDYVLIQKSPTQLDLYIDQAEPQYLKTKESILHLLYQHHITEIKIQFLMSNPHQKEVKLRRIKNETQFTY